MDGKGIENILLNIVLGKKTLSKHKSKRTQFCVSSLGNALNKFSFGIVLLTMMTYDLWNLKLSYLNQFQQILSPS